MMENECADARNEPIEAKLIAACADGGRVNVTPEKWKRVRSLLDSYANALVAATVEACAKRAESKVKSIEYDEAFDTDEAAWLVAQAVRNVTPESAAKELERIKGEARLDGFDKGIAASAGASVLSSGDAFAFLFRKRAELEAAARKGE